MTKHIIRLGLIFLLSSCGSQKCFQESIPVGLEGYWVVTIDNHPYSEIYLQKDFQGLSTPIGYFSAIIDTDQVNDFEWFIIKNQQLKIKWRSMNNITIERMSSIVKLSCDEVILQDSIVDLKIILNRKKGA